MQAATLIACIEDAWRDVPRPPDSGIFTPDSYDDEDIVNYFSGTTWRGHHAADLRAYSSAFTFFTPAAWHYWLPAFVIAAIEEPEEADACVERLTQSIYDDNAANRVALLSTTQRHALCEYFRFQIARWPEFTQEERRALSCLEAGHTNDLDS